MLAFFKPIGNAAFMKIFLKMEGHHMNLSLHDMRQDVIRIGGFALVACFLVACGGPPNWVKEGSGVLNKDDSKSIYGVGAVTGVKNEPLAWETAENRARAELAKTFRTYTAYLMQDYAASTAAGNFTKSTEEQNVERAVKTFSAVTLNGVRPVDRYKDDDASTYYVLTKLSFEEMKEALQQAQELDAEVREFVRKNAE
jgi:hypothetical protein